MWSTRRVRRNKGFTLAEVMVVLVVMGILATMSVPSFTSHIVKTQVAESMAIAKNIQTRVERYREETESTPANRVALGLPADPTLTGGKFVQSVNVSDGMITVVFRNGAPAHSSIQGKTIEFTPYISTGGDGYITWICGDAPAPESGVELMGSRGTTNIDPAHLPMNCRSSL